jgi:hypothetical protein
MDDIRQEFWGDLQADLYTENTAIYLANQSLENIISTNGYKAHKPILSHPDTGTYTPHSDITFQTKTATKQTLQVDTFLYAAEDIDITEKSQTPYDLMQHSLMSIRKGLMNQVEQKFTSEFANAGQSIQSGTATVVSSTNVLDILEEAEGKLGAFDVSLDTAMKAIVFGPRTVAKLRRAKSDRESRLGDETLANGVVGSWQGWTVVQNNNLPWSASLTLATQPTDGDTVTISGVTFTFKTVLGTTAGNVLIGASAATARANLKSAVEGTSGAGTTYVALSARNAFNIRRKRKITTGSASPMLFVGFGDIAVSETLTAAADVWSAQQQKSIFMQRGAIDLVLQFIDLETAKKEKGFADLTKGIIGVGTKTFSDGADLMVNLTQDVSAFV